MKTENFDFQNPNVKLVKCWGAKGEQNLVTISENIVYLKNVNLDVLSNMPMVFGGINSDRGNVSEKTGQNYFPFLTNLTDYSTFLQR